MICVLVVLLKQYSLAFDSTIACMSDVIKQNESELANIDSEM